MSTSGRLIAGPAVPGGVGEQGVLSPAGDVQFGDEQRIPLDQVGERLRPKRSYDYAYPYHNFGYTTRPTRAFSLNPCGSATNHRTEIHVSSGLIQTVCSLIKPLAQLPMALATKTTKGLLPCLS